jgi:hypothetical protein
MTSGLVGGRYQGAAAGLLNDTTAPHRPQEFVMATFAGTRSSVVRNPFARRRRASSGTDAPFIASSDYIPAGTADLWRSARRRPGR